MEKRVITSPDIIKKAYSSRTSLKDNPTIVFENKVVDLDFKLNSIDIPSMPQGSKTVTCVFKNCDFLKAVDFKYAVLSHFEFINCSFKEKISIEKTFTNIIFRECFISNLDCEDAIFGAQAKKKLGKLKLYTCELHKVNFKNATFHNLVNFFNSKFYEPVTFYKTKFFDTAVFSAVNFKENVLFSYTEINESLILRGTYPEKGFDLSLAIIRGNLNVFNFQINDYNTYNTIHKDVNTEMKKYSGQNAYINAYQRVYYNAVTRNHLIPVENKRETYRIIKNQLESQKNFIDAIPYKVKESRTHFKESWQQLRNGVHVFNPISNLIVLSLNGISNWFGSSYIQGAIFTVLIGGLFFTLGLSHISDFKFTWDYEQWQWEYFVQFLNPTHRFDYMKAIDENPRTWFFIWDFIGRIFVSYGIYQTIQAFRKYK